MALLGCDPHGNCSAVPLASLASTGSAGCGQLEADLTDKNYRVDNVNAELLLVGAADGAGFSTSIAGVVLGYKLQISPAPLAATFADVPTDHPYFRAIEALSASGITSGCGGSNFCPLQNVTRGEMAVFLARALGLQFP